ncbi:MAG TPA: hypothetical protein VME68_07995 [Acidobacteriaceae bacterium]|nr:hypothetical protein [Acidobacteriaceae bacterium]
MSRSSGNIRLPIAAFVAERRAEPDCSPEPTAVAWKEAETARFYRPLTRPLTLGSEAIEHLRRGQ